MSRLVSSKTKKIKYKVGDIIVKIDPTNQPVSSDIFVIAEEREDHFSLRNTKNRDEMWFFKEGELEIGGSKLKMNSVAEFHYFPNEKNKTKNR